MDFGSVLHAAQQNKTAKKDVKYYSTKFEPPKKVEKTKTLSDNIKKFLAKKEEEEKRKAIEAKRKRDELLASRDPKLTRKIQKMLKVCKSANKSVLEDAVDHNNTAVTLTGCEQPDEDDYGYVSQEATALYSKMMEKYKNMPEEKMFPDAKKRSSRDLLGTKDRVRAALIREKEEALLPHKRKRKSKSELEGGTEISTSESHHYEKHNDNQDKYNKGNDIEPIHSEPKPKPKIRRPYAPPLDFNELLKIAEKKQFEPVQVEPKRVEIPRNKEPERLMTLKEKREYEELRAWREQRARREKEQANHSESKPTVRSNDRIPTNQKRESPEVIRKPQTMAPNGRIPKLNRSQNIPQDSKQSNRKQFKEKSHTLTSENVNERHSGHRPSLSSASNDWRESSQTRMGQNVPSRPDNNNKNNGHRTSSSSNSKEWSESNQSKMERNHNQWNKDRPDNVKTKNRQLNVPYASNDYRKDFPPKNVHRSSLCDEMKQRASSDSKLKQYLLSDDKNTNKPSQLDMKESKQVSRNDAKCYRPQLTRDSRQPENSEVKDSRKFPPTGSRQLLPDNRTSKQYSPTNRKDLGQFPPTDIKNAKQYPPNDQKNARQYPPTDQKNARQYPPSDIKNPRQYLPTDIRNSRQLPPADTKTSKQFPPTDVKNSRPNDMKSSRPVPSNENKGTRQFPPVDIRSSRQFPPNDIKVQKNNPVRDEQRKRSFPSSDMKKSSVNKRRILDDDSEYDSELDDFIDDGPDDKEDYSKYIKDIFGYDKSRYRDEDDDDRNMESNYAQQQREEYISKKIGIMEDLEDMKMEAMENERKAKKRK